jgi:hypothetical protein
VPVVSFELAGAVVVALGKVWAGVAVLLSPHAEIRTANKSRLAALRSLCNLDNITGFSIGQHSAATGDYHPSRYELV